MKPSYQPVPETETTILIVDGNDENRYGLSAQLQGEGYQVLQAGNGESALALLKYETPDLILMDIFVAVEDNFESLKRMKKELIFSGVPVLMLAGIDEIENVVSCIEAGAKDYLTRPFNPTLLHRRIEVILKTRNTPSFAKTLGSYTIERKIGAGGMADVYLANHAMLRRPTAVKILRKSQERKLTMEMFEHEVQLTSALSHPNTIYIYDYGRTPDGLFYYAMEFLDGINLTDLIRIEDEIPESRIIHIMQQVCASLEEAHQHKVIHRDIKPPNIMLCERGGSYDFVKVLDFGIAKESTERDDATEVHASPLFISPETATANLISDGRSDLYSLGAVGYYLLTKQFVFDLEAPSDLVNAHANEIPERPSLRTGRKISLDFEALIMNCLEKKKEDRPNSAKMLSQMLGRCESAGQWTPEHANAWWEVYLSSEHAKLQDQQHNQILTKTIEIDFKHRSQLKIPVSRLIPPRKRS